MRILLAIFAGKIIYLLSKLSGLGAGGTWPGEIALKLSPNILKSQINQFKEGVIIVAGTNGKTTTSMMIKQILTTRNYKVIHNDSGANLLNGIVSAFIQSADWLGKIGADWGVFEVDENTLPQVVAELRTANCELRTIVVLLNLFRDQLDRYGEVDVIAEKWEKALGKLPVNSTLVLNADDPLIAHLGKSSTSRKSSKRRVIYFGVNDDKLFLPGKEHATDSIFCLNCGGRLEYTGIYYSHIGIWKCVQCGEKRPSPNLTNWDSPLPGLYNLYNTLAAVSVANVLNIKKEEILSALKSIKPAFGRQEEFEINGPTTPSGLRGASKKVKILLSKNPVGFNESLKTIIKLGAKQILFVLNDRIPDGRDVSWIWDVDFEMIPEHVSVIVSGKRVYDMAVRIKYTGKYQKLNIKNQKYILNTKYNLVIEPNLRLAIEKAFNSVNKKDTLYILPTYSAMLEVRKILGGRKIL